MRSSGLQMPLTVRGLFGDRTVYTDRGTGKLRILQPLPALSLPYGIERQDERDCCLFFRKGIIEEYEKRRSKIMNDAGFDRLPMEMDLASRETILRLIEEAKKHGKIAALINAAGPLSPAPLF